MALKDIQAIDIVKATKFIDDYGVEADRESRKYSVERKGKNYPIKYLLSIAHFYRTGEKLSTPSFIVGKDTPAFRLLDRLNFKVVETATGKEITTTTKADLARRKQAQMKDKETGLDTSPIKEALNTQNEKIRDKFITNISGIKGVDFSELEEEVTTDIIRDTLSKYIVNSIEE